MIDQLSSIPSLIQAVPAKLVEELKYLFKPLRSIIHYLSHVCTLSKERKKYWDLGEKQNRNELGEVGRMMVGGTTEF